MIRDIVTRGALAVALLALAALRPHLVERWALYLGSPSDVRSAHLFLDPFPDAASCETRVRTFEANGESAFCSSRHEFEFGSAQDAVLAADFDPFFAYAWYCSPHPRKL
jgi:hypothetical protein